MEDNNSPGCSGKFEHETRHLSSVAKCWLFALLSLLFWSIFGSNGWGIVLAFHPWLILFDIVFVAWSQFQSTYLPFHIYSFLHNRTAAENHITEHDVRFAALKMIRLLYLKYYALPILLLFPSNLFVLQWDLSPGDFFVVRCLLIGPVCLVLFNYATVLTLAILFFRQYMRIPRELLFGIHLIATFSLYFLLGHEPLDYRCFITVIFIMLVYVMAIEIWFNRPRSRSLP